MTFKKCQANDRGLISKIQFRVLGVFVLCLSFCATMQGAQSVPLAWDANPDSSVAGYVVYYGNTNGSYSSRIDVGTNTTTVISGLTEGGTNYFAVTAYNAAHVESPFSSQVTFLVPGLMRMASRVKASDPLNLSFPVAPGHWYEVQAAADMKSWATIWQSTAATSNAWVQFQDPKANLFSQRFYRLILH